MNFNKINLKIKNRINKINFNVLIQLLFIMYIFGLIAYIYLAGLQGDDIYYARFPASYEPINSINDMIRATNYCYQTWNGRYIINFLNHFIIHYGMLFQTIVVILSYLFAVYSLFKLSKIKTNYITYFFLLTGFFALTSTNEYLYNITCLNISLNYFFIIPFYTLFLHYLLINKAKYSFFEFIGLSLLGFLCGCFSETYSFSIALLILFKIINKQFDLHWQNVIIGTFYIIGILILLLCPGSSARGALIQSDPIYLAYRLNGIISAICKWALLPILLFYTSYKLTKQNYNKLDNVDKTLFSLAIIQIVIMCFSPYLPERSVTLFNLILITLSCKWLLNIYNDRLIPIILAIALCGQLIIQAGVVILL